MARPKEGARATLIYDAGCSSCTKFASLVRKMDLKGRIAFESMYDPPVEARMRARVGAGYDQSFHLILEPGGRVVSGEDALEDLAKLLPAAAPLAGALFKVPGVRGAAAGVYRAFAAGRACAEDTGRRLSKD